MSKLPHLMSTRCAFGGSRRSTTVWSPRPPGNGSFRAAVIEQAGLRPGQRVLDLGCGTGSLAIEMARHCPGLQIFGLDGDATVLAKAERKATQAGAEITWQQGLATRLPYPDASFDRAVSTLFFHHLAAKDKVAAATELYRVLRPGRAAPRRRLGPPDEPAATPALSPGPTARRIRQHLTSARRRPGRRLPTGGIRRRPGHPPDPHAPRYHGPPLREQGLARPGATRVSPATTHSGVVAPSAARIVAAR